MTVHEQPVGASVEWYTPASLFDALFPARHTDRWERLPFDLDPAAAPNGSDHVPAKIKYDRDDDGLAHEWQGRVWLNPPYGPDAVRFVLRMIEHGNGLLLLPSRTETRIYQRAFAFADVVCLLENRLWFTRSDGKTGRSSFGSTLFAFGAWAAEVLDDACLGVTIDQRHLQAQAKADAA